MRLTAPMSRRAMALIMAGSRQSAGGAACATDPSRARVRQGPQMSSSRRRCMGAPHCVHRRNSVFAIAGILRGTARTQRSSGLTLRGTALHHCHRRVTPGAMELLYGPLALAAALPPAEPEEQQIAPAEPWRARVTPEERQAIAAGCAEAASRIADLMRRLDTLARSLRDQPRRPGPQDGLSESRAGQDRRGSPRARS